MRQRRIQNAHRVGRLGTYHDGMERDSLYVHSGCLKYPTRQTCLQSAVLVLHGRKMQKYPSQGQLQTLPSYLSRRPLLLCILRPTSSRPLFERELRLIRSPRQNATPTVTGRALSCRSENIQLMAFFKTSILLNRA
jgi:hypothetical protein